MKTAPTVDLKDRLALSQQEAADLLGVSIRTVFEWSRIGLLTRRKVGRTVFYLREDIEAMLARGIEKPTT